MAQVRNTSAGPTEITLEVDVDGPAERTFAAATDWARQREWMLGTDVRGTAQDGRGVGGGISARTGLGPLGFTDTMVITRWDPPYACHVRHTGRLVRGTASFDVRERPGGSTFIWSEQLDLPLGAVGRLGFRVLRPVFAAGVAYSLRQFATWAARHPDR